MKTNKGFGAFGIFLILAGIFIAGGSAYLIIKKNNLITSPENCGFNGELCIKNTGGDPAILQNQNNTKTNPPVNTQVNNVSDDNYANKDFVLNGNNCYDRARYFVISRQDKINAGNDILVKYKTSKEQKIDCKYSVDNTDYEIKNTYPCGKANDCSSAQYFSSIYGNILIADEGTGVGNRDFVIYALEKRVKIFNDSYFSSSESSLIPQNNIITYWQPTNKEANSQNCSNYSNSEFQRPGVYLVVLSKISLDLSNLTKKELGLYRCAITE